MTNESAVHFETESRIHMGLAVADLDRSVAYYRTLFGRGPTKVRPGYAKFEVAEPPVNLSLNLVGGPTGPNNPVAHFGVQVKSTAVEAVAARLREAGLETAAEENVTCCYAVQNKVWSTDPNGNKWEVYVVLDNDAARHHPPESACCADRPDCCEDKADCCEDKADCCAAPGGSAGAVKPGHQPTACACPV